MVDTATTTRPKAIYVRIEDRKNGKSRSFPVYNADVDRLYEAVKKAIDGQERSNGVETVSQTSAA